MQRILTVQIRYISDEEFNEDLDRVIGFQTFGHLVDAFEGDRSVHLGDIRLTDPASGRSALLEG
jgi:hypothetical protein